MYKVDRVNKLISNNFWLFWTKVVKYHITLAKAFILLTNFTPIDSNIDLDIDAENSESAFIPLNR